MTSHEGHEHAPRTVNSKSGDHSDAIPTVSATGMPRIIPRHKDKRSSTQQEEFDEKEGSAPPEMSGRQEDRGDEDGDEDEDEDEEDEEGDDQHNDSSKQYPPTGSLMLAAFNPYTNISPSRRFALISGSVFINLGLPFLNGVMLGFGEIFARVVLAPALGITGVGWTGDTAKALVNWPWLGKHRSSSSSSSSSSDTAPEKNLGDQQPADFDNWAATTPPSGSHIDHVEL